MTPKEKADEIIEKIVYVENNNNDFPVDVQMALIMVNELITQTDWTDVEYWQEVKREIEKL